MPTESSNRLLHWENIYQHKGPQEVSWTQDMPEPSLSLIAATQLTKDAPIIDIGGGDSTLVDHLLDLGYIDLTVLDISARAISRAKERLQDRAQRVNWIVADITEFVPERTYAIWHDRAAFHFLLSEQDRSTYAGLVENAAVSQLILGTFSVKGPIKCSGLEVRQNDCDSLAQLFEGMRLVDCVEHLHHTPFNTEQRFIFGRYERTA